MALEYLRIYQSNSGKIRVGPDSDGGYILVDGLNYDCIVSCGIGNDMRFEKVFCEKYPNIPYMAVDGMIDRLPEESTSLTFIKKNIAPYNSDTTTTLSDIFDKYNDIFLKMDIETFEFRWLQSLSLEQLSKIKQLIIEFHYPFTEPGFTHLDVPLPVDQKQDVLKKIYETHTLIHLHPNNCCGIDIYEGFIVPNVFECTYIRKDVQDKGKYSSESIPTHLDRPNVPSSDIYLNTYPFVVPN